MYTISQFLKELRKESGLTQPELANSLGVSPVLISMIEANQKNASKNFLKKLSERLDTHPGALAPFAFNDDLDTDRILSPLERKLIEIGTKLQKELITKRAKKLQR